MGEASQTRGDHQPYPNAGYAWSVTVCLQIAFAIALIDRGILALLVQPIKADLGLTDTQFSLLAGMAFAIFYAVMGLALGRVADRWNRRNMIIVGMILWSFATMACGLARNFQELFLARVMVGVGEAALSPCAYSMIADYFPKERRSRPLSFYTMGIYTGSGIALVFGATAVAYAANAGALDLPLIGTLKSWQIVFILVGLPGMIMAAVMLFVLEPERRELASQQTPGAARPLLSEFLTAHGKLIVLVILAFALNGVVYYGIGTWTPALFIRKFDWTAPQIGYALGTLQLVFGTSGIMISSWLVSRPQHAGRGTILFTLPRTGLLIMMPLALVFGFANSDGVVLVALAGLIFLGGFVSAQSAVALYQVTPNDFRGVTVAAYLTTGTMLGLGIGSYLFASITDNVFQNEAAVGKSCGIVFFAVTLLGAECLRRAARTFERSEQAL